MSSSIAEFWDGFRHPVLGGRPVREEIDGKVVWTTIYRFDRSLFWVCVLPVIIGAVLLPLGVVLLPLGLIAGLSPVLPILMILVGGLCGILGLGMWPYFRVIPKDKLAVINFLGHTVYFTNCRVFAPAPSDILGRYFRVEFHLFVGSQENIIIRVKSRVKLNALDAARTPLEETGQFILELVLTLKLAWRMFPARLTDNYLDEFWVDIGRDINGQLRRAFASVGADVKEYVEAKSDAILQAQHAIDLVNNAESVNNALLKWLQGHMLVTGVILDAVSLADTQDAGPDGWMAQYQRAVDAERTAESVARQADASKNGRIAQAAAEQEAQQREQEAQREIALAKQATQTELLELARRQALTAVQDLVERLKVYQMDGAARGQILRALEQLKPEQLVPFVEAIASAAGIKTEGGSLLFAGGGGAQDARLVTALGIGVETLKSFGLLAPTVPAPAPAPPAAP